MRTLRKYVEADLQVLDESRTSSSVTFASHCRSAAFHLHRDREDAYWSPYAQRHVLPLPGVIWTRCSASGWSSSSTAQDALCSSPCSACRSTGSAAGTNNRVTGGTAMPHFHRQGPHLYADVHELMPPTAPANHDTLARSVAARKSRRHMKVGSL